MQPLNSSERKKAFINFLVFFIVTVTIIITVVFFSIEVPFTDNKLLRDKVALLEDEKELSRNFLTEFSESSNLLKTLDSKEVRPAAINTQIDSKINKMNALIQNVPDSQSTRHLYSLIENITLLKNTKEELSDLQGSQLDEAKLRQENLELRKQLDAKDLIIANYQARERQTP